MKIIQITVRCEATPEHAKVLRLKDRDFPANTRAYADSLAKLLDGTSEFYIFPPGPRSPIGKCAVCQGKVTATVEEVEMPDAKS